VNENLGSSGAHSYNSNYAGVRGAEVRRRGLPQAASTPPPMPLTRGIIGPSLAWGLLRAPKRTRAKYWLPPLLLLLTVAILVSLTAVLNHTTDDPIQASTQAGLSDSIVRNGQPTVHQGGSLGVDTSKAPDSPRTSPTTVANSTMPPTTSASPRALTNSVSPPTVDATQQLRALAAQDEPNVEASLIDQWVPQISAKKAGLEVNGHVYSIDDVLRNHLEFRQRYPDVRLVWSGDFTSFMFGDFWVTVVGEVYASGDEANGWMHKESRPTTASQNNCHIPATTRARLWPDEVLDRTRVKL